MKTKAYLAVAFLLSGCNGPAETPTLGGALKNHTDFPSSAFLIETSLRCRADSRIPDCKTDHATASVSAQGSFSLRPLQLPGIRIDDAQLTVRVRLNQDGSRIAPARTAAEWKFDGEEIARLSDLKSVSVYALPEQPLVYHLSSGGDSKSFAEITGRDSQVTYSFDFGTRVRSSNLDITLDGLLTDSVDTLPASLLFTPGDLGDAPEVKLNATLNNPYLKSATAKPISVLEFQIPLTADLPLETRSFPVDDLLLHIFKRDLSGIYKARIVAGKPGAGNIEEGKLAILCNGSVLTGGLDLAPAGATALKAVSISGECDGEQATLRFELPDHTPVTAQIDRVGGDSAILLTRDLDADEKAAGQEYSRRVKLRGAQGEILGVAEFGARTP